MSGLVEKFRVQRRRVVSESRHPDETGGYAECDEFEDLQYPVFVLRIDGKDPAAMEALRTYAMATNDAALAADLAGLVDLESGSLYNALYARFKMEVERRG